MTDYMYLWTMISERPPRIDASTKDSVQMLPCFFVCATMDFQKNISMNKDDLKEHFVRASVFN